MLDKSRKSRTMIVEWPYDCVKAINRKQEEIEERTNEKVKKPVAAVLLMQELLNSKR